MRNKPKWYSMFFLGLVFLLAGLLVACGQPTPPVVVEFSATPAQINAGEAATLLWHVTEATTLSIDQGVGNVLASGTSELSPNTTTTYTLTATNAAGTVTKSIVITIWNTYTNDFLGYIISYPDDWVVRDDIFWVLLKFEPPPDYSGGIDVAAMVNAGSVKEVVLEWLRILVDEDDWYSIDVLENYEMQGKWDWYVSFDGTMEEQGEEMHGEIHAKQEGSWFYIVHMFFEKANYYDYPLTEIIETFEVTTLSWFWYSDKALTIPGSVSEALDTLMDGIALVDGSISCDITQEAATSFTNKIVIYRKQWAEIVPPKAFVDFHTCYADTLMELEQVGESYAACYGWANKEVGWTRAFMEVLEAMNHLNECIALRQEIFENGLNDLWQVPHYGSSSPPT